MINVFIHFLIGSIGVGLFSIAFNLWVKRESSSFPIGLSLVIGISCASTSNFISPWATPIILAIVVLGQFLEYKNEKKAIEAYRYGKRESGDE